MASLEYGRGRRNARRADVAGDALERMGQPLRERIVASGEGVGDVIQGGALLLGKLAEDLHIECPVSSDASQAIVRVEAGNRRDGFLRRRAGRLIASRCDL